MSKLFSGVRKNRAKSRRSVRMGQSGSGDNINSSRNYSNVMASGSGSHLPSSGSVTPLNLSAEFMKPSDSASSIPELTKQRSKTSVKAHWTPEEAVQQPSPRTPRKDSPRTARDSVDSPRAGSGKSGKDGVEMDEMRPRSRSRSNTDMTGVIPITFALKKKKAKKPTSILEGSEAKASPRDRSSTVSGDSDAVAPRQKKSSMAASTEEPATTPRTSRSRKIGSIHAESSEDPAGSETGSKRSNRSTRSKRSRKDSNADSASVEV